MTGFIIFATASPYFDLKKISVVRDSPSLSVEEIERVLNEFYGQNLLFLQHERVRSILREEFPEFREIDITEKWPSELELRITVSPPFLNLLNTETANFSVISLDGVILAENPDENLPVVKVFQHEKPILPRQKFLEKKILERIGEAEELLKTQLGLQINAVHLLYAANEVHFISRGEMAIWIDLALPIKPQVQKLVFAADKIGLHTRFFDHIDLRIPKQVFWKPR